MKGLVFRYSVPRLALSRVAGAIRPGGYLGPWSSLRLEDVPEPRLHGDEWALVRVRAAGICGSDAKQAFLRGDRDNPLTALISFPHVLGHEAVGHVERLGPAARGLEAGQRVVINPWLSCVPRGVAPACVACADGQAQLCRSFTEGRFGAGIHAGNCRDVGGAFASQMAVHASQCMPVPDGVTDEQAVLADPVAVQLHAVLRNQPSAGSAALVYGCGTLGLATIALLRALHPETPVWAIARHRHQAMLARQLGAAAVLPAEPREIIAGVAGLGGWRPLTPWQGAPWLMDGPSVIYDTVGSPETVETALRIAAPRGAVVVSGVEAPRRFEWTLLYFKEIRLYGSNAFGVETFEGREMHAMAAYFELVRRGLDLGPLVTHRFALAAHRRAMLAVADHARSGAVKVLLEP